MHRAAAILVAALVLLALASGSPYSPDPSLFFRSYNRTPLLDRLRCAELEHPSWGSGGGRMGVRRLLFSTAAVQWKEHTWSLCGHSPPGAGLIRAIEAEIAGEIRSSGCVLEAPGAGAIRYRCGEGVSGSARVDIVPQPRTADAPAPLTGVRIRIEERIR